MLLTLSVVLAGIDVTDNDVVPANSDVTDNGVVPADATDDSVVLAKIRGNVLAEGTCGNSAAGIAASVLGLPEHSIAETPARFESEICKF